MNAACSGAPFTFVAATRTVSAAIGAATGVYTCTITADDTFTNGQGTATFTITVGAGPV
jgi:hypothetical protein